MEESLYWPAVYPIAEVPRPEALPSRCDVCIIGGGLTGLSAALYLARKGAKVALFEKGSLGSGASGRSAGMALPGFKVGAGDLVRKFGLEKARQMYSETTAVLRSFEEFLAEESIDCDFHRGGELVVAYRPRHMRRLESLQACLKRDFDHEVQLVSRGDLRAELASDRYHGGLLDPIGAGVNPAKLVSGLAAAALRHGALIFENTAITGLESQSAIKVLTTETGVVEAAEVLAATNAYTPEFLAYLSRRVIRIRSFVVVTEPLGPDRAAQAIPNDRQVYDSKNLLYYFRRTPDHRILIGGPVSFWPTSHEEAAVALRRALIEIFPMLDGVRIDHVWHGQVAGTFDHMPHLGVRDGVHHSLGYFGHGVILSTHLGTEIARIMAGEEPRSALLGRDFPAWLFHRRHPLLLPFAGTYYRIRDWLF